MIEQMDGSYDHPFKFNAKELDEDSGLYDYRARYFFQSHLKYGEHHLK